jgi:peptidoglycan/LPS O-acetylase OafA/YrhL
VLHLSRGQDCAPLSQSGSSALDMQMMGAAGVQEGRVFHTLDALRGIAAIGVVVFHIQQAFEPIVAAGGYLAVDLFFMMSGVVLSHAYESRFQAGMGTLGFMRARLIRLYPLYLLGALLGIGVALASLHGRNIQHWDPSSLLRAALRALLFLPNVSAIPVNQMFPLNIPCWSLFLEILVNLLFVIFWPLLNSRRLIVLSLLTGGTVVLAIMNKGSIDQGSIAASFPVGLARTIFGFSVGVLIARHVRHVKRGTSNFRVLAILAVVVIAIAGWPIGAMRAMWDAVCVLGVFPLMVYCGTLVDPGPWLVRIATFLGVTSYAVYVLHSPLSAVLNSAARFFAGDAGVGAGAPYLGIAVLAALLTGCWLVDRYIDMPIRRYLSRIVPRFQALRESRIT